VTDGGDLTRALARIEPLVLDGDYTMLGYERGTAPPSPADLAAESYAVRIDDPFETTFVMRAPLAERMPEPAVRVLGLRAILLTDALPSDLTGFISTWPGRSPSGRSRSCRSGPRRATTCSCRPPAGRRRSRSCAGCGTPPA
jgi:hypothetical protein